MHMSAFGGNADMTGCRESAFAHRPPLALVGQLKDNQCANCVIADCRKPRASPLNKILFQQFAVVIDAPKKDRAEASYPTIGLMNNCTLACRRYMTRILR